MVDISVNLSCMEVVQIYPWIFHSRIYTATTHPPGPDIVGASHSAQLQSGPAVDDISEGPERHDVAPVDEEVIVLNYCSNN